MSMELEHTNGHDTESRDTVYLMGGAAMVLFGAGLILSTPMVRRYVGGVGVIGLISAAIPDIGRYMRIRNM